MSMEQNRMARRGFLRHAAVGAGAAAIGHGLVRADEPTTQPDRSASKVDPKDLVWRNRQPDMTYERLGRTNFMVSRVVQGFGGDDALWRRILSRGINYIDCARGYGNYEVDLRGFLKRYRDKVWLTSKATGVAGYNKIDEDVKELYRKAMKDFLGDGGGDLLELHRKAVAKQKATGEKPDLRPAGQRIADLYSRKLDESLDRTKIECFDAYFMHGVEIPWMFDCLEVWEAYEKAHKAGKVKHFGFSTHNHVKETLAAGVEADRRGPWKIDLIMPAVNPVSFADPAEHLNLKEELTAYKERDIGVIAMKTTGVGKGAARLDWDDMQKKLGDVGKYNEVERKKLWMLNFTEGLIDAVIVQMRNNEHLERGVELPAVKLSADARRQLRAIVQMEMAGMCHLCGSCATVCPEEIAVTDMVRYHAYVHQYDDKALARELFAEAGYDPSARCTDCGRCADVCPSNVPITDILHRLPSDVKV